MPCPENVSLLRVRGGVHLLEAGLCGSCPQGSMHAHTASLGWIDSSVQKYLPLACRWTLKEIVTALVATQDSSPIFP